MKKFHNQRFQLIARTMRPLKRNVLPFPHSISSRQKLLLEELNSLPAIGINKDSVEILRSMRKQKRIQANVKYGK